MGYPVYYPEENDVLPVFFDSFAGATGASITLTGLAVTDIEIYKDGSVTQRASDAGYVLLDTDGIDFDGITGIHGFSIDLGDDTTAGFFVVGPWYHVVVSAVTIDGQTVNFVACAFQIRSVTRGLAGTALPAAAADAAGGLPISDAGGLDLDSKLANTHEVTAARMGALTDWINGGRLDLILDIIAADTTTDIPALIADLPTNAELATALDPLPTAAENAAAVWDEDATGHQTQGTFGQAIGDPVADTNTIFKAVVTDATGATVGVDVVAVKAETAAILVDTAEIGAAGAGLTAINLPDQTMDITGNITGNLSGSVGSVTGAVGSVTGNVGGNVTGTIGGLTAAALKDFFDTDSTTNYAGAVAGSVVKEIADNAGGASLTVQDIVDGVWDEPIAGHVAAGSTGEALDDAGAAGTPPTVGEIADAVWDEDATGHQTQGTFGQAIGDPVADANTLFKAVVTDAAGANVAVDIIAVKAETAAILADTAEIGTAGAGLTNINLPNQAMDIVGNITGNLSGSVGSVTGLTASNLDATISSRASQASVDDIPTNAEAAALAAAADDAVLTEVALVKAKTDNLPSDPADASVVAGLISAVETKVDTVDTVVDAIKLKTDSLPADPADASDIASATSAISAAVAALKIKKNAALAAFPFKMVLAADGSPATGLTVTATRSIDGGAFAACANAVTEISAGWYKIDLAASDLNGNTIALKFTAALASARGITIVTQP